MRMNRKHKEPEPLIAEPDTEEKKALQMSVIYYLQHCLTHCKTKEEMSKAVETLNLYLESLPIKKALNTSKPN